MKTKENTFTSFKFRITVIISVFLLWMDCWNKYLTWCLNNIAQICLCTILPMYNPDFGGVSLSGTLALIPESLWCRQRSYTLLSSSYCVATAICLAPPGNLGKQLSLCRNSSPCWRQFEHFIAHFPGKECGSQILGTFLWTSKHLPSHEHDKGNTCLFLHGRCLRYTLLTVYLQMFVTFRLVFNFHFTEGLNISSDEARSREGVSYSMYWLIPNVLGFLFMKWWLQHLWWKLKCFIGFFCIFSDIFLVAVVL